MPRIPSDPQPAPTLDDLLRRDVTRERALFAVRIGELRLEREWNYYQLADAAGLRSPQIEGIESGTSNPSFSTIIRLCVALGLHSLDELLVHLPVTSASN